MNPHGPSFTVSHDLTVVPLKPGRAYLIPVDEWDVLKDKCHEMSNEPWFFHSAGFLLLGAGLATFIAILLGTYSQPTQLIQLHDAKGVVVVATICGGLCLFFARKQRGVERTRAHDVVTQMELIEQRYDRPARSAL
jgi:hypothetical protein